MKKINKPFVIVFAHKKGGVGKTSTACNVAVELHKREYPLSVIDLDSQKQTTKFNNKREKQFKCIDAVSDAKSLISFLKKDTGITLIDLGGYDSNLSRTTLLLADLVIIPLNDSDNELDGLLEFKIIMDEILKVQSSVKCSILLTRLHHSDTKTHKAISSFVKDLESFNLFNTVLRSRKEYKRMLGTGKSVSEQTMGTGKREMFNLIDELEGKINE